MTKAPLTALLVLSLAVTAHAEKITKETVTSQDAERTYYLFVPDSAKNKPAPLIILLHGSGRDGKILVEHWQSLAKKEGIILAGPDSTVRAGVGHARGRAAPAAPCHRGGADRLRGRPPAHVCVRPLGRRDPRHCDGRSRIGVLCRRGRSRRLGPPSVVPYIARAPRKIPIAVWVGTNDANFPVRQVRESLELLNRQDFNVELTEIPGHTHNYYGRSSEINKAAWAFLQGRRLDKDPQYQDYAIGR